MKIDHKRIIENYRAAYHRANGRELAASIAYEHGWFAFRYPSGFLFDRLRAAKMEEMTGKLAARAREQSGSFVEDDSMAGE
jgi:hypothetical protein